MRCGEPPRAGAATASGVQRDAKALVGPMTPKSKIHYTLETIELYFCYCIEDIQSLKYIKFEYKYTITLIEGNNNQGIDIANQQQLST